ncbi:hypothetical protein [Streptosporangium carneum]|uniref:asparagine synthase (glutamine-hydrolyzing) n=1 Tax=Streptosporangium carneum TaxID=47481 RepID=A0A9W6IB66_9ACTN|nr:hypothetical protein [Streptosporangium carneum]GLK14359.1 hypothetical protein GCM10017600_77710 [Streptosporangium carneum]
MTTPPAPLAAPLLAVSTGPRGVSPLSDGTPPFPGAVRRPLPGGAGEVWSATPGPLYSLVEGAHDHDYRPMSEAELTGRIREGRELGDLAAPFAAVLAEEDGALLAAVDQLGMRHLYLAEGPGWAALSTSPTSLARLTGGGLDLDVLGAYRLIGHHLGTDTPYAGVRKIPAGHVVRLSEGRATLTPYKSPGHPPTTDLAEAVRRAARILRDNMERLLDEHPDAVLQLSGGLDSRILLAAVPEGRRRQVRALTLASVESRDQELATRIATAYRLERQVIDMDRMAGLTPARAHELVTAAALSTGGINNPVQLAVQEWAEAQAPREPRINGFGGEFSRAFYYLGQRQHPGPTPQLVDRLAEWRIFSVEYADPEMFTGDFAAETKASTMRRLREMFAGYRTDWLSSTDEFYFHERTQRMVGATLSTACTRYTTLSPMLHPAFVEQARAMDPAVKLYSRYNAMLLDRLAPDLARIPLDTGLRPVTLFAPKPVRAARLGLDLGLRAARKARQRIRRSGNPGVGEPTMVALLVAHWRAEPSLLEPALGTGLVRQEWLARMLSGEYDPTPGTAAFLAILCAASTALA